MNVPSRFGAGLLTSPRTRPKVSSTLFRAQETRCRIGAGSGDPRTTGLVSWSTLAITLRADSIAANAHSIDGRVYMDGSRDHSLADSLRVAPRSVRSRLPLPTFQCCNFAAASES